jgi:hypothetical protein
VAFLNQICFPFLLRAQKADGGWGYQPESEGSVEATSWALLALTAHADKYGVSEAAKRGCEWLLRAQLSDGSWPVFAQQETGCWVTTLATLALRECGKDPGAVARGQQWLCQAWPGEGGLGWRLRRRIFGRSKTVQQDFSLRGWSWTPGTSSWVEPTAYALLALRQVAAGVDARRAEKRRTMAEAMLKDRMCPGGGWNCGNPLVYGTPGQPLVGPTVWALLALSGTDESPEVGESLEWLESAYKGVHGPGSLALAHLCLNSYGRATRTLEEDLARLYETNEFFGKVHVMAWSALALGASREWFRRRSHAEV